MGVTMLPSGPEARTSRGDDTFTFTVGKLDAGMAILIGERASLIEFPSLLLPQGVTSGSVVNIRVLRNEDEEQKQKAKLEELQEEIMETFGKVGPTAPKLRLRNVTQTSVTLEWDRISLAQAQLLGLDIFRNGQRLAPIPNPMHNTSTKLSGLDVDAEYSFHLLLRTTAGTYASPIVKTRTHTMQDTSGIAVCFGHIEDPELEEAAKEVLKRMGCQKWTERIQIETTHFVCTDPRNRGDETKGAVGTMYNKAAQLSIPMVQPHWIFACYTQRRMVPISAYYLGQDPPNAGTLRETLQQIREPPNSSASDRMMPPTPVTANGMQPQTPSAVPHIDATTGETKTGGVSVREGVPPTVPEDSATDAVAAPDTKPLPVDGEELAEKEAALKAQAQFETASSSGGTQPPTPYEKDFEYSSIGGTATAGSAAYAQAAPVSLPQSRVVAAEGQPEAVSTTQSSTEAQSHEATPTDDEKMEEVNLDSGAPTPAAEDADPPAEEEIDLS